MSLPILGAGHGARLVTLWSAANGENEIRLDHRDGPTWTLCLGRKSSGVSPQEKRQRAFSGIRSEWNSLAEAASGVFRIVKAKEPDTKKAESA